MTRMTKLVLLAGISAIASDRTLAKLRNEFDFDRIHADYAKEITAIATGNDGIEAVDHLRSAMNEVLPGYNRPTNGNKPA